MQGTIDRGRTALTPTGPTGDPLLLAKLDAPPLPPATLGRPRLLELVSSGASGRLTVLSAPAGSGKTTLVLSWIHAGLAPGPVVWMSLDALDRQPGVFWSYVRTGLSRTDTATSDVPVPDDVDRLGPSFLPRLSAALYERREPVVLVLDDVDVLAGAPVCGQLDFLLRNAGPAVRLVLLTRDEPGVPLPRYRLAGAVTEIGAHDLAATRDEAASLLALRGVDLPPEALGLLVSRTRGWMAGLVLSGAALGGPQQTTRSRGGAPGAEHLEEYVDEEVLRAHPASVRRFLIRTSIADHLPAGLAEDLAGKPGAARLLSELVRHDAFVTTCDEHADCYRYHPLLHEVLRARLEEDAPGAQAQLHRRAAAWFVRAGEPTEAAVHAARAQDWPSAAKLLVGGGGITRLLTGPDSGRLGWLMAELPADVAGADAAVVRAAIALAKHDSAVCAAELERARPAERDPAAGEHDAALALSASVVGSGLAAATGDATAAVEAGAAATALLAGVRPSEASAATHLLVVAQTARALMTNGRATAALTVLQDERQVAPSGCDDLRRLCVGLSALAEAMRGRSQRAIELAGPDPAAEPGRPALHDHRPVVTDAALAWAAVETARMAIAKRELARLTGVEPGDPLVTAVSAIVRARVHRAEGDLTEAVTVLEAARRLAPGRPPLPWLDGRLAAEAAATWTSAGRPDLAARALAHLDASAGPEVELELARAALALDDPGAAAAVDLLLRRADLPLDVRVDAWLLRAAAALERRDTVAAAAAGDRALRTAAPERLRRPFRQAPARLRGFLRHHGDLATRNRWLDAEEREPPSLPRATPAGLPRPRRERTVLVEELTPKEHEVLVNLAELLSTEEIASQMYVSINTVRTHVRAILRKLAATRRNEAIRRARELGVI